MKWVKALKRKLNIMAMSAGTIGYHTYVKQVLGKAITARMIFYQGDIYQQYDLQDDVDKIGIFLRKNLNPRFAKNIMIRFYARLKGLKTFSNSLEKLDFANMTNRRLKQLYLTYCAHFAQCITHIVIPRYFDYTYYDFLVSELGKAGKEGYNTLVVSDRLTAMAAEQLELLRLALKDKVTNNDIKLHANKFNWLPCHAMCQYKLYSEFYFKARLAKLRKKPRSELQNELNELLAQKQKNQQARKQILRKLKLGKKILFLFDFAKDLSTVKAEANELWTKSCIQIFPLFSEIAARLGMSFSDFKYLVPWEVADLLESKTLPVKKILRERKKYCLIIFEHSDKIRVYSGKKALERFKMEDVEESTGQTELTGLPTYTGKVRGRARVVFNLSEAAKLKKGEILITSMTIPGFAQAISKAAAIATDEGGATCHAAIISREFKKPCVVGTRHATSVFRTGDIVEVDATKGIVRKCNPKKS